MHSPSGSYLVIEENRGVADLLDRWVLPGEDAGAYGLRLAVRNGYLNLYVKGQSVGEIRLVGGSPRLKLQLSTSHQSKMAARKSVLVVKNNAACRLRPAQRGIVPFSDGCPICVVDSVRGCGASSRNYIDRYRFHIGPVPCATIVSVPLPQSHARPRTTLGSFTNLIIMAEAVDKHRYSSVS